MRLLGTYQVFLSAHFYFSLLFLSNISSKFLHIAQHARSIPLPFLVVYSPTIFLLDILVLSVGRFLLRTPETQLQVLGCVLGVILAVVTWTAAAMQFGFFLETGAEVEWKEGSRLVGNPAAFKLLLSGLKPVCFSAGAILIVSWMASPYLHTITGKIFLTFRNYLSMRRTNSHDDISGGEPLLPSIKSKTRPRHCHHCPGCCPHRYNLSIISAAVSVIIVFTILQLTRPAIPYNHLSSPLPITLLQMWEKPIRVCHENDDYPFPEQISEQNWEPAHGDFPGWAPTSDLVPRGPKVCPVWFPACPYTGFHRWTDKVANDSQPLKPEKVGNTGKCVAHTRITYDPTADPTKISNLDLAPFEPLTNAFTKNDVHIEHIVLITLESARKEVFPMQQGSLLWDSIIHSHASHRQARATDILSRMTPVAQMLTNEWALNARGKRNNFSDGIWQDQSAPGMGGINVNGALTGSTLTFKSMLGSHCGVNPLPVDMLEEVNHVIYQPCLPHIFRMLNDLTTKHHPPKLINEIDFRDRPWTTVFMQSITDSFDRQRKLNRDMGFHNVVVKETMTRPGAKHPPSGEQEVNYFGFAESAIDPYIRDLIFDAARNESRLFLSHITSTTHHPWGTPDVFPKKQYFGKTSSFSSSHEDTNDYLNAVAYVDNWLGQILKYIDQAGIADKTLVVFVGDHGQAFEEDSTVTGTFENAHISNFRVPLVFRHPRLPRFEISANITSLSIVPTILDLLINTQSLNPESSRAASALLHEYQGQSLIRPFRTTSLDHKNPLPIPSSSSASPSLILSSLSSATTTTIPVAAIGIDRVARPLWIMSVINAGGRMLSILSANTPFRLVMPIDTKTNMFQYRFTHTKTDPYEKHPIEAWSVKRFQQLIKMKYGDEASRWTKDALKMGKWWVKEQTNMWGL